MPPLPTEHHRPDGPHRLLRHHRLPLFDRHPGLPHLTPVRRHRRPPRLRLLAEATTHLLAGYPLLIQPRIVIVDLLPQVPLLGPARVCVKSHRLDHLTARGPSSAIGPVTLPITGLNPAQLIATVTLAVDARPHLPATLRRCPRRGLRLPDRTPSQSCSRMTPGRLHIEPLSCIF
jgi:hypothetical protein